MKKAFLTGATGFLGRHIVDVLKEQQVEVIALVRSPEKALKLLGEGVTCIKGDLTDLNSVCSAMPDHIDAVIHAAADTSSWYKENALQTRVNVEGTANMLRAALDHQAKRFVHVSSISVFGHQTEDIRETSERRGFGSDINYVHTKTVAERKVREAIDRGMDGVIVNPTHIVGRYDDQNWARLILMATSNSLPGIPPGGGNFANGRAVAEGVVAALKKGGRGESYILGGPFGTFQDFLKVVADQTGLPISAKPIPGWVLKGLAVVTHWKSLIDGKRPTMTREEAAFACDTEHAISQKAVDELGYRIVPLEQSVAESLAYLQETGVLKLDRPQPA